MRVTCFHSSSCVLLLMLATGALPCGQSQQGQSQQNPAAPAAPVVARDTGADPVAAPAAAMAPQAAPAEKVAISPQEQRAATETAALLKMATELKAAVDKSNKDTLSLAVIRKADEIERAARGMKDRYRASAGMN